MMMMMMASMIQRGLGHGDDLIKREHFIGMRLDKVDNLTGFSNTIEKLIIGFKRFCIGDGDGDDGDGDGDFNGVLYLIKL
jgi:hypothetical protein